MAKAEALDAVGENRAATELVARYLGVLARKIQDAHSFTRVQFFIS